MTDDLVERLYNNCSCNFLDTPCGAEEECRNAFEAAHRIKKLEAALRTVKEWHGYGLPPETTRMIDAALEGKDD